MQITNMSSLSMQKLFSHLLPFVIPLILFTIFVYKWLLAVVFQTKLNLPPSPPRLPIIGNLHQLGKFPHRSLRRLSQKYGDYVLLYLGNKPTLVISSATAAEQIMRTHDVIFANRPKSLVINKVAYGGKDVVFNSYCEKWRKMKSICITKLLNNKRVESFKPIREKELGHLIEEIKSYNNGSVINLSEIFFNHFKNLISMTVLGKKYNNHGHDSFSKLFKETLEILGVGSVGDYVPFLSWIDKLNGFKSKAENLGKKLDEFVEYVVNQHLNVIHDDNEKDNDKVKDLVDILLEIQRENPEQLTTQHIKAIILDMFVGGTETISTTLDWAMTELIRHPKVMEKVQQEVRSIVKANARVTEDDLENLKYLKAVVKETLRLHLPGPLLIFRESSKNVKIDKYDISERTQVIINALAIHLDPKYWQDPEEFIPERFLNDDSSSIDFKGQHFQYIPFGGGRRGCPGITYGIVNAEIVLASLLYEFNWKLPNGRQGHTLDTEESSGLAVGRRNPLMVIATMDDHMNNSIS